MDRRGADPAEWMAEPPGGVDRILEVAPETNAVLGPHDLDASTAETERQAVSNVSASRVAGRFRPDARQFPPEEIAEAHWLVEWGREEEPEMLPCCADKISVTPCRRLASGRLTRDWSAERTLRSETDQIAKGKYDATADTDRQVVARVAEVAEQHGVPRVHIALAWLLQKEPVAAPIVGATKTSHLDDSVGALSVTLTPDDVAYLEAPYVPHAVVGHQ